MSPHLVAWLSSAVAATAVGAVAVWCHRICRRGRRQRCADRGVEQRELIMRMAHVDRTLTAVAQILERNAPAAPKTATAPDVPRKRRIIVCFTKRDYV